MNLRLGKVAEAHGVSPQEGSTAGCQVTYQEEGVLGLKT